METLVANLSGQTRLETLNGIDYIVAPVTMIVPGVLNGSKGPLFYPSDETQISVDVWNGMPLVVYHPPKKNGVFPSARTPDILEKQGVGTLFNTRFVSGKLASDAYFDIKRTAKVDNRVLISLQKNQQLEVSTGLFTDNEQASEGSHFEGKPYTHIARNYRPDHLAILPDQQGACSVEDGCGVLNSLVGNGRTFKAGMTSANEGHQHQAFVDAQGFGVTGQTTSNNHVHEIREFRVLKSDGHNHTLKKSSLVDTGIPNSPIPDTYRRNSQEENKMIEKKKEEMVDSLIENTCCWKPEDKEFLINMDDAGLKRLKAQADSVAQNELVTNASKETWKDEAGSEHTWNTKTKAWDTKLAEKEKEDPVTNEVAKPLTIEQLSPELQQTIHNAQRIEKREKDGLIEKLIANVADGEKANQIERLQNRSLEDLRGDLALMPVVEELETSGGDYFGSAGGGVHNQTKESELAVW